MQLSTQDGVVVAVMFGEDCGQLWPAIEPHVVAGHKAVVVDLAQVDFLNSLNIAALISAQKKVTAAGGRMALSNLKEPVRAVFRILRLERLFTLDHDRAAAQAAVRAPASR